MRVGIETTCGVRLHPDNNGPYCHLPCRPLLEAEVAKIHTQYFAQIRSMFDRHKTKAGYPKHSLVFQE